MGDLGQQAPRWLAPVSLAIAALLFLVAWLFYVQPDDWLESTVGWDPDIVGVPPQILMGIATSFLFIAVTDYLLRLRLWITDRGYRGFFGHDIASGDHPTWLVHPRYTLADEVWEAIRVRFGSTTSSTWSRHGTASRAQGAALDEGPADAPGDDNPLPIDFDVSIAANDVEALLHVASAIQRRDAAAPVLVDDSRWRLEYDSDDRRSQSMPRTIHSLVAAGLTATAVVDVIEDLQAGRQRGGDLRAPLFNREPIGRDQVSVRLPEGDPVQDDEDWSHGVIVRYAPDRALLPDARWFVVAGLSAGGTPAAGVFLGKEWRQLASLVPDTDDFVAIVRVPTPIARAWSERPIDASDVRVWALFRQAPGGPPVRVDLPVVA